MFMYHITKIVMLRSNGVTIFFLVNYTQIAEDYIGFHCCQEQESVATVGTEPP